MGFKTAIFTGDKSENAQSMANHLGIDLAKGDPLPKGKLSELYIFIRRMEMLCLLGMGLMINQF